MEHMMKNGVFGLAQLKKDEVRCSDVLNLKKIVKKELQAIRAKNNKKNYILMQKKREVNSYKNKLLKILKRKILNTMKRIEQYSNNIISSDEEKNKSHMKANQQQLNQLKITLEQICSKQASNFEEIKVISQICNEKLQAIQLAVDDKQCENNNLIEAIEKPYKILMKRLQEFIESMI